MSHEAFMMRLGVIARADTPIDRMQRNVEKLRNRLVSLKQEQSLGNSDVKTEHWECSVLPDKDGDICLTSIPHHFNSTFIVS